MATLGGTNSPDTVHGTSSDDYIYGWSPANAFGNMGPAADSDTLFGHDGNDRLNGGNGADHLFGGAGDDDLFGAASSLSGAPAPYSDLLDGGIGNDRLFSNGGNTTLLGGSGDDLISAWGYHGRFHIDGGNGLDVLEFSLDTQSSLFTLTIANPNTVQTLPDGSTVTGIEVLFFTGGDGDCHVTGGNGADDLTAGLGQSWLDGAGGNDTLRDFSHDGPSTLISGGGDDMFFLYHGPDVQIFGGSGIDRLTCDLTGLDQGVTLSFADPTRSQTLPSNLFLLGIDRIDLVATDFADTVTGGQLGDTINGAGGHDVLSVGDGNDLIEDTVGNNTLFGGGGRDVFITGPGSINMINGGGGLDRIELSVRDSAEAVVLNLATPDLLQILPNGTTIRNVESITFIGSAHGDTVTGGDIGNDFTGGDGNDSFTGGAGGDEFDGGLGDDTLSGGDGEDYFFHTLFSGACEIVGGLGTDGLWLTTHDATTGLTLSLADPTVWQVLQDGTRFIGIDHLDTFGTGFDDHILGGSGNDFLGGQTGSDFYDGAGGNDTLQGGQGGDTLFGGTGNDRFEVFQFWGSTGIQDDVVRGGAGRDNLSLDIQSIATIGYSLSLARPNVVQNLAGVLSFAGIEQITFSGSIHADTVTGGAYGDLIGGNDGDDRLFGAGGNDTVSGGYGYDRIDGGAGADVLVGGGDYDMFLFSTPPLTGEVDRINDFTDSGYFGRDVIALRSAAFAGLTNGPLAAADFVLGTTAQDTSDRILYDQSTGQVWYDADGTGGTAAVHFIDITPKPVLVATDFLIL